MLGLALATSGLAVAEDAVQPPGPLRIRDMTPPAILTLGFMPASAALLGGGTWGFELHYSVANIFLMSDSVKAYLEQRDAPRPLSSDDVAAIVSSTSGDAFYFDGEIGIVDLGVHYGLTEQVQLFAELPCFTFSGGSFDHAVMEFHNTFGLDDAGRNLVARDRYQVLMKLGSSVFSMLEAPSDGFGDPTFGVRHRLPSPGGGWLAAAEWAVKPAVADADRFLSNGHTDYGLQLMLQKGWRRSGLYLSASYVWLGEFDLADFTPADVPSATVAYTDSLGPRLTGVVQGLVARSIFARETRSELASIEYQVSAGLRYRRGPVLVSVALTENVANYQNTPDIGLHLSTCWVLQ